MSVISLEEWRKKQEKHSNSTSQSKLSLTWDELGATPTESSDTNTDLDTLIGFWIVLDKAAREPFTVKSNFARKSAWFIAVCSSKGLLTTEIDYEIFGNQWLITEDGQDFKEAIDEHITNTQ